MFLKRSVFKVVFSPVPLWVEVCFPFGGMLELKEIRFEAIRRDEKPDPLSNRDPYSETGRYFFIFQRDLFSL